MKGFLLGLILGMILGALATIGVLKHSASHEPASQALSLPAAPCQTEDELSAFLDACPYEIGFCARDTTTGRRVERFADRSVCLASMVKVFCLTELYRRKNEGSLDLSQPITVPTHGELTLLQAADLMIGQSDNPATYALADFLGYDQVNRIPSLLGLESLSESILPEEATLRQTLDKRIFGDRVAAPGLPQHGTARAMAQYYELLLNRKVLSPSVSDDLIAFFRRHPKPFTNHYAETYIFAGKGGNLLWTRPPKHYSMMGWGLFLTSGGGEKVVPCVWGEWFPESMPPDRQSEFLEFVTDSIIAILEGRATG